MSINIETVIASAAVAWFSARVTVYYALHRFRQESLWKERLDAYKAIVDALYNLTAAKENERDHFLKIDELTEAEQIEQRARVKEAYSVLYKEYRNASFLLSDRANTVLQRFYSTNVDAVCRSTTENIGEQLDCIAKYFDEIKNEFISQARSDLNIRDSNSLPATILRRFFKPE